MRPEVVRTYTVPRWFYTQVRVYRASEIRVDPDAFHNSSKYRMRLIALTFGAPNETPYTSAIPHQPAQHPAWTNNLLIDVGKSGCGDMNIVRGTATALCGQRRYVRTMIADCNMGRNWRLPTPYMLPRDEGLRVSVEYIRPQYQVGGQDIGPVLSGEVTFIAKGYKPDGYPAMLAGRCDGFRDENRGSAILINSSDLFNNGKTPMFLTELCFKELDTYRNAAANTYFFSGHGCNFAWQVNPTNPTFTQWMPQPRHIPTALLTPMCRSVDGGQESPVTYFFPEGTYLDPKQALGIKLGNTAAASDIRLDICLAGELEVK